LPGLNDPDVKFITMIRSLFFSILFLITTEGFCQDIIYLDSQFKPVAEKNMAEYYRKIEKTQNIYVVKDFLRTGKIQMLAYCSETEPKLVYHGKVMWYEEKGYLSKTGNYKYGEPNGLFRDYDKGKLRSEYLQFREERHYISYWTKYGIQKLVNGSGDVDEFDSLKNWTRYKVFKDSLLLSDFSVRHQKNDTLFHFFQEKAEYPGGLSNFYKEFSGKFIYPVSARRHGIEGTIYAEFVVGKDGRIEDIGVVRGIDPDCNEAAVTALGKVKKKWIPAHFNDRTVKTMYTLPIVLKLSP
jgi:TonB family protein